MIAAAACTTVNHLCSRNDPRCYQLPTTFAAATEIAAPHTGQPV